MSQDTQEGQIPAEGQTAEPMPSSEKPAEQNPVLPEDASERTKAEFEKLIAKNKELAEKVAALEQPVPTPQPQFSSVLDELTPRSNDFGNLTPAQVEETTKNLTDENGFVDMDLLNKTLREADERARLAEKKAKEAEERIEKFEETQITREVHGKYPQLDPYNPNFDSRFYEFVKNDLIGQMMQGKKDYMAAAQKAEQFFANQSQQEKQKAAQVEENKRVISQREQASVTTGSAKAPQQEEYESLVKGTVAGDNLSIGQRLIANGH